MKAPQIRFKEFDTDWEDEKIGEVLAEKKRPVILKDHQRYELITVKRRNEGIVSRGHLYGREILVKNYAQLETGDFVISKRQVVHGATGMVPSELDGAIVSNEYLVAVNSNKLLTEFMTLLSCRPAMRRKFFLSSYGVDIEKLFFDSEDWKKRSVAIPYVTEQAKIVKYFRELDSLIGLHQRKRDKLVALKKSMLQKMFPQPGATTPEIRFKGFEGDWEQKKLGEIFSYERPDKYIVESSEYSSDKKIPVLTANKAFILGYTNETRTFNNSCIIFDDFTLEAKFVDFPFMVKSSAIKLLTIQDSEVDDLYFGFLALNNSQIEIMGHARHYIGFVQPTLVRQPRIVEQRKIGAYFRSLDDLISQNAIQVQKLQQIKFACLEKMFV